jgi:hypothetical protein
MRFLSTVLLLALVTTACSDSTAPTPMQSTLTIAPPAPSTGATIHVTVGAPPGLFIPRGSGQLSIPVTVTSARDVPWAQLYVYLMTGPNVNDYCGQNLPDAPTWAPFAKGQTVTMTISGFQIARLPCEVTGIRAFLHTRNSGTLTPPISTDTVAEGSMNVTYHLVP